MGQKFIFCAYEQRFFLCFALCQMLIQSQTGIEKKIIFKDLPQPLQDPCSPPSWKGVQAGSPPCTNALRGLRPSGLPCSGVAVCYRVLSILLKESLAQEGFSWSTSE